MKTSEIVKASRVSRFHHFRNGEFVYQTDTGFQFPIPLYEVYGGGSIGKEASDDKVTLNAEEHTLTLMRWIRVHVDTLNASPESVLGGA